MRLITPEGNARIADSRQLNDFKRVEQTHNQCDKTLFPSNENIFVFKNKWKLASYDFNASREIDNWKFIILLPLTKIQGKAQIIVTGPR